MPRPQRPQGPQAPSSPSFWKLQAQEPQGQLLHISLHTAPAEGGWLVISVISKFPSKKKEGCPILDQT